MTYIYSNIFDIKIIIYRSNLAFYLLCIVYFLFCLTIAAEKVTVSWYYAGADDKIFPFTRTDVSFLQGGFLWWYGCKFVVYNYHVMV